MKFGEGFDSFVRASFVVVIKISLLFTHLSSKILQAVTTPLHLSILDHVVALRLILWA